MLNKQNTLGFLVPRLVLFPLYQSSLRGRPKCQLSFGTYELFFLFVLQCFLAFEELFQNHPHHSGRKPLSQGGVGVVLVFWVWGGLLPLRILLAAAMTQMGPRNRGRISLHSIFFPVVLWYSFLFRVLPERYEGQPKLERVLLNGCLFLTQSFISYKLS